MSRTFACASGLDRSGGIEGGIALVARDAMQFGSAGTGHAAVL